ncbi:hypothetical protein ECANGB1_1889 [Enterospora canceri]|uniref:Uncharacterized protein n=1 Tax=Enterospora canceri TaxID=1081671 RepID=A0A1Y1S9S3_9MICR|nr:hypothetical protein ECANGB1_1889 [Enterospora canceri]
MNAMLFLLDVMAKTGNVHLYTVWGDKGLKATARNGADLRLVEPKDATLFFLEGNNKFFMVDNKKYVLDWNQGNNHIITWTNKSWGDANQKFASEKALADPAYIKLTNGSRCFTADPKSGLINYDKCNGSLNQVFHKEIREAKETFKFYTKKGPFGIKMKLEVKARIELISPDTTDEIYYDEETNRAGLATATQSAFEYDSKSKAFVIKLETKSANKQTISMKKLNENEFKLMHDGKCLAADSTARSLKLEDCADNRTEQVFSKVKPPKEMPVSVDPPVDFKLTNKDNTKALKGGTTNNKPIDVVELSDGSMWSADENVPSVDLQGKKHSMDYMSDKKVMGMWSRVPGARDQRVTLEKDDTGFFLLKIMGLCGAFDGKVIKMKTCDESDELKFNKLTADDEEKLKSEKANPETVPDHYEIQITGPSGGPKQPTIRVDASHRVRINPAVNESDKPEIVVEPAEARSNENCCGPQPIGLVRLDGSALPLYENGYFGNPLKRRNSLWERGLYGKVRRRRRQPLTGANRRGGADRLEIEDEEDENIVPAPIGNRNLPDFIKSKNPPGSNQFDRQAAVATSQVLDDLIDEEVRDPHVHGKLIMDGSTDMQCQGKHCLNGVAITQRD